VNSNKYTLDRYDDGFGVFLAYQSEQNQLLIRQDKITITINEGDIVEIHYSEESGYCFRFLEKETSDRKQTVSELIEKLKSKNATN